MNIQASSESSPVVGIVIVVFEGLAVLEKCLDKIEKSTYKRFYLILVDNSLSDTIEFRYSKTPNIDYTRTGHNLGFSRACNLGIARSMELGADYTWILNPDTEIDAHCLEELIFTAKSYSEVGIVAGKIYYMGFPDRIWYAGGKLSYVLGVGRHFQDRESRGKAEVQEVSYATGCCMFIPNVVFKRIGFLKEKIFMYLDDAEFCMRVRRYGYKIFYNPTAVLGHAVGSSIERLESPDYYLYFSLRNKPLVADGGPYRLYLHVIALLLATVKLLVYGTSPKILSRGEKLRAIVWGAWDSLFEEDREEKRFPRLFSKK